MKKRHCMKTTRMNKPSGRPIGQRALALMCSLVGLLVSNSTARASSWHDEIGPHFPPNVPSSASGPVDYTYEFFGFADGRAGFPLYGHLDGRTWEYGTRNGTPVTWHGVDEHSGISQYSDICSLGTFT